ncbi:putative polyketide synthase [Teratosphaeria nubilosa]|uniref:Putative polyketide synthase n=1 Tax=Teratosphaeria nubilosa TaxID=161662 RepID=A0A6G1L8G0_9PEZI|nr:putative polyketide synthase [Teratosphaeria nubilosa]
MEHDAIAVIGYAYRAPGVGRTGLWDFLEQARNAWSPIPQERFDARAYHHTSNEKPGCLTSQGGHFLPGDVFAFDAPFFNLKPDEARFLDPQVRMALECSWEAMEMGGMRPVDAARAKIGVFAAVGASDYGAQIMNDMPTTASWACLGIGPCMSSNRISHFFDLTGPSVSLESACATGAYALHMACQSLRLRECTAALVSAATLILGPENFSMLDTVGTLSPDGITYSYDARCNGFGRGEGATCLLLKPLAEALRCGDPIRCIVRNTSASHCGRTPGISMPSQEAHESLFRALHEQVGLDPRDTPCVEGHGTGTPVGDPVDASAVAAVFGRDRSRDDPVVLGSIKSNIGHLEIVSGLLAVIKSIMMIERGVMLPTASFEKINPAIVGADKLRVLTHPVPWPDTAPRRVCVSNYGFGGANAAVLLESLSRYNVSVVVNGNGAATNGHSNGHINKRSRKLVVFSAKSPASLESYLAAFRNYVEHSECQEIPFDDLCFTLGQRRASLTYRASFVAESTPALLRQVVARCNAENVKSTKAGEPRIAFVFTGQGAQYIRMAVGLSRFAVFAATMREADEVLRALGAGFSLQEELALSDSNSHVNSPHISQPACTAIQIGLVRLLRTFGIRPCTVVGHSSGEIAGAYTGHHLTFKAALAVAYFRGKAAAEVGKHLIQRGGMLAVGASAETAAQLIAEQDKHGHATIAAYNSPESMTISGDCAVIEAVQKQCETKGIFARRLKVDVAYHSHHMQHVARTYLTSIMPFCKASQLPSLDSGDHDRDAVTFISSVTGKQVNKGTLDASYWVKNLLEPVQFLGALQNVLQHAPAESHMSHVDTLVEIGPHPALSNAIRETLKHINRQDVSYLPSLSRETDDHKAILDLSSILFLLGADVDLASINQISGAAVLTDLPPYQWNATTSFRHHSRLTRQKLRPQFAYSPLLGWKNPFDIGPDHSFRQIISLDDMPWLRDHSVAGDVIFPMAGFLSLATEAMRLICGTTGPPDGFVLKDVHVKKALRIEEVQPSDVTTRLTVGTGSQSRDEWRKFEILSWSAADSWAVHCYGMIKAEHSAIPTSSLAQQMFAIVAKREELPKRDVSQEYAAMKRSGITWGPEFAAMSTLRASLGKAVHTVDVRSIDHKRFARGSQISPVTVDPPILDAMVHSVGAVQGADEGSCRNVCVPTYMRRCRISNKIDASNFTVATDMFSHDLKSGNFSLNVAAFNNDAETAFAVPVLEVEDLQLKCIAKAERKAVSQDLLPESYVWTDAPCLDLIDQKNLAGMFSATSASEAEMLQSLRVADVGTYYTALALETVRDEDLSHLPPHFEKWLDWARKLIAKRPIDSAAVQEMIPQVMEHDAQGRLVCLVGERLVDILRGKVEPLEIILQDGLLNRSYEEDQAVVRGGRGIAKYVRMLAAMKPDLRILEVGGGTASTTPAVLDALESAGLDDILPFHYTFTDISAGFFPNAKEKLSRFRAERITYQKLDISQDPLEQGFVAEHFDLAIAGNVLHATPNIEETLRNVRTLLKPGGKLVMLELVDPAAALLPLTLLPGWWLSEDRYRSNEGPVLSSTLWDEALQCSGFSGIELSIPVSEHPTTGNPLMGVICTSNKPRNPGVVRPYYSITVSGKLEDTKEHEFAGTVCTALKACHPLATDLISLHDLQGSLEDHVLIIIDRPEHSLLADLRQSGFDALKDILLRAVAKVVQAMAQANKASEREQEFVWSDGQVRVPRLVRNMAAKSTFQAQAGELVCKQQPFWPDHGSSTWEMTIEHVGEPATTYFQPSGVTPDVAVAEDVVLIRSEAVGLDLKDLQIIQGQSAWTTPGFQGVGEVVRVGAKVDTLKPGDRVIFCSPHGGAFANYIRMTASYACKLQTDVASVDAACVPIAFITAYVALLQKAELERGDQVLIWGASNPVGQASIVLAKSIGAEVFAAADTQASCEHLRQTYGIPSGNVFICEPSEVREAILLATDRRGVGVVLNTLDDSNVWDEPALVADFGCCINVSTSAAQGNLRSIDAASRNVTFVNLDIIHYMRQKPQMVQTYLHKAEELLLGHHLQWQVKPRTILPVSKVTEALQIVQSEPDKDVVVTTGTDNLVVAEYQPLLERSERPLLKANATYLITGGTGGIGRSLAVWMFEHGATHVVLLGRSGASRPKVAELLERYENDPSTNLKAIACDVGRREELACALTELADFPPVRGVVHGALFMRDSLFSNLTLEDWTCITKPKVQGVWNLDEMLPDLDFFISLASMNSVVGLVGSTVYAGTSSFLDAFTKHRLARGKPATSIHLPIVEGVGYVVDHNLVDDLKVTLGVSLTEAQVLTLVHGAILGPSSGLNADGVAISGILSPPDERDIPWRHWPHTRVLAAGLTAADRTAATTSNEESAKSSANGLTEEEACADLLKALTAKVAEMIMSEPEEIPVDVSMARLGLDSLVSVELRNWIRRVGKVDLPLTKIAGARSLGELAAYILSQQEKGA